MKLPSAFYRGPSSFVMLILNDLEVDFHFDPEWLYLRKICLFSDSFVMRSAESYSIIFLLNDSFVVLNLLKQSNKQDHVNAVVS